MSNCAQTSFSEESVSEIPYIVLTIAQEEKTQILQKVASSINVQLTLDEVAQIPFISPSNFQQAKNQDKLFFYGPGGSGKSRLIFEFIKARWCLRDY